MFRQIEPWSFGCLPKQPLVGGMPSGHGFGGTSSGIQKWHSTARAATTFPFTVVLRRTLSGGHRVMPLVLASTGHQWYHRMIRGCYSTSRSGTHDGVDRRRNQVSVMQSSVVMIVKFRVCLMTILRESRPCLCRQVARLPCILGRPTIRPLAFNANHHRLV